MGKLVPPDNHAGVLGTLVPSRDPISSPQSPQNPALLPLMEKLQRQFLCSFCRVWPTGSLQDSATMRSNYTKS